MATGRLFRKLMLAAGVAAFAAFVHATDMDHKGRVIATVATKNSGTAEVTCNSPGGWKFDVSASQDAGRDYRSVPDAVNRLMKDVLARLKKIKPDVLVEFRQHYMGPAILQYGNMMRAADCTADPTANRKRI